MSTNDTNAEQSPPASAAEQHASQAAAGGGTAAVSQQSHPPPSTDQASPTQPPWKPEPSFYHAARTENSKPQVDPNDVFAYPRVSQELNHSPTVKMEIHDATGAILDQFTSTNDAEVGATAAAARTQASPQQQAAQSMQPIAQNGAQQSPMQQAIQQAQGVRPENTQPTQQTPPQQQPQQTIETPKKPTRMPGTKQCPSCQGTIAAAVAKCPKCGHVFRAKKEKPKRSGKRGKKNCPKCQYENPSACSSCKNCKYVFRLKLVERYKQMRPRTSDGAATAAVAVAAAAHVGLAQAQTGPGAPQAISSTSVPMPAGVTPYHASNIAPQIHPAHSAIPSLAQHSMSVHHVATHNVHPVPTAIHPMPQHPMHPHQTHPQL